MNIFAGNFSLMQATQTPDIDFDIIELWQKSYFIMWADESLKSSQEVITFLEKHFGALATHDISIEWEDMLEILSSEYEIWAYECVSFEWPDVDFEDILERFAGSSEAICIRQAQESQIYANRVIKADFMY